MISENGQFGDLSKLEVSIAGKDVSDAIVSMNIFQDIFSPSWNAQLLLLDTTNVVSHGNMKGGDPVSIKLETKQGFDTDHSVTINLVVDEIHDRVQQGQNVTSFVVNAVHPAIHANQRTKVCEAYQQKKIDDIVKDLASKIGLSVEDVPPTKKPKPHTAMNGGGNREPSITDQEINFISATFSPLNAIGFLMSAATCKGKTDFVFHQKDNKTADFCSLDLAFKRPCVTKFVQRPNFIRQDGEYRDNKNLEFSHFIFDHFNHTKNIASGFHGASVTTFELTRKKWSGNHKSAATKFIPKHDQMYESGQSIVDTADSYWPNRRKELFKAEQNLVKIQLPGQVCAFQWLCEPVEIDIPDLDSTIDQPKLDQKYKGKYLITSIGHMITKESYYVNLELANGWE